MQEENQIRISAAQLLEVLRKCFVWLIVAAVVGGAATFLAQTIGYRAEYTSTQSVYIRNASYQESTTSASSEYNNLQLAKAYISDCQQIIVSRDSLRAVETRSGYALEGTTIKVTVPDSKDSSHILTISVTADTQEKAQAIAMSLFEVGKDRINNILGDELVTPIDSAASFPAKPSNARFNAGLILGVAIFAAAAVYAIFCFVEVYQDKIVHEEQITEKLGIVLLGSIPNADEEKEGSKYGKYGKYKRYSKYKKYSKYQKYAYGQESGEEVQQ